jgi:hypothetical protein
VLLVPVPPEAIASMPKPVQKSWDLYQQAVATYTVAVEGTITTQAAVKTARSSDVSDAEAAAAKGKPLPALTLPPLRPPSLKPHAARRLAQLSPVKRNGFGSPKPKRTGPVGLKTSRRTRTR